MSYEIRNLVNAAIGEIQCPKYEVYDVDGCTDFSLSSATYKFIGMSSGSTILSGNGVIDNSDTDTAGNTIKTIQLTLDLTGTDIIAGNYLLVFTVTLSDSSVHKFRVLYEIADSEEVY